MSQEFNKAFQSRLMMDGKTGSEVCPFCKKKVTPCEYEIQPHLNSSKILMDLLWDDLNYVPEVGDFKSR